MPLVRVTMGESYFNEEGSRRLGMSIAPLFLPALLDHRGAWSLPDAGEAGPMPQWFSAPALSEKKVLAYGDSLTAGFYMAGQRFSPYGEALSRELGDVDMWVCGLSGLTAVQLFEGVDARLIVDVACRRGQGLGSILEERGPFDLVVIMVGTNDLAMGVAPGVVLRRPCTRSVMEEASAQWRWVCPRASSLWRIQASVPSVMK